MRKNQDGAVLNSYWVGVCICFIACSALMGTTPAAVGTPLTPVAHFNQFSLPEWTVRESEGQFLFSAWNTSGNSYDVLALDATTGTIETIVRGVPGARFVARDADFLLINKHGSFTSDLLVLNRKTGRTVKKVGLQRPIQWATIDGSRLFAVQEGIERTMGSPPGIGTATILVISLPALNVLKTEKYETGSTSAAQWRDLLLTLTRSGVRAYDFDLTLRFEINLPELNPDQSGSRTCVPIQVQAIGDTSIVRDSCGVLYRLDLNNRQVVRLTAVPASSVLAIADDFIFALTCVPETTSDSVAIYDLKSGRHVSDFTEESGRHQLDLKIESKETYQCTRLLGQRNSLLAVQYQLGRPSQITLYRVEKSAIDKVAITKSTGASLK